MINDKVKVDPKDKRYVITSKSKENDKIEVYIKLKKRANFTSVLLCVVFSYIYVIQVFN